MKKTTLSFLAFLVLNVQSINAQFIARGQANFSSCASPKDVLYPVQLYAEDYANQEGIGIGNILLSEKNKKYFSIVRGGTSIGITWCKQYYSDYNVAAIKTVLHEGAYFMLYQLEKDFHTLGGIVSIDQATGAVINNINFDYNDSNADFYTFIPKDIITLEGNLFIVGADVDYSNILSPQIGKILCIEPKSLGLLHSKELNCLEDKNFLSPEQLTTDGKYIYIASRLRTEGGHYNVHVSCLRYIGPGKVGFVLENDKEIFLKSRLYSARIAYNPYENNLILAFQQWQGYDAAGTVSLMKLQQYDLTEIEHHSYIWPQTMYNSDLQIDEKYIYWSGAHNVYDAWEFGARTSKFDHNGNYYECIKNPYSINILGDEPKIVAQDKTFLFATRGDQSGNWSNCNWILGFGTSKECELTQTSWREIDEKHKTRPNMILKGAWPNLSDYGIKYQEDGLEVKIECGNTKGRQAYQKLAKDEHLISDALINIAQNETTIHLTINGSCDEIKIIDLKGAIIHNEKPKDGKLSINKSNFVPGIYIIYGIVDGKMMKEKLSIY